MSLYWILNLTSLSVPFLVSFHPRIQLYKKWKALSLAIILAMIPYIIWDIWFTENGYWGFNLEYLSGVYLLHLPIEEWFFFVSIPYACIFTHYALIELFPKVQVGVKQVNFITYLLLGVFLIGAIVFNQKWYTFIDLVIGLVILVVAFISNKALLQKFYLTFIIMLIPFFVVNGILTGTGIENEVVWYNDLQNLGIRFGTIPIEDSVYAFSLILLNLVLFEKFSHIKKGESIDSPKF